MSAFFQHSLPLWVQGLGVLLHLPHGSLASSLPPQAAVGMGKVLRLGRTCPGKSWS